MESHARHLSPRQCLTQSIFDTEICVGMNLTYLIWLFLLLFLSRKMEYERLCRVVSDLKGMYEDSSAMCVLRTLSFHLRGKQVDIPVPEIICQTSKLPCCVFLLVS